MNTYIIAENFVKLYCQNHCGVHFNRCENPCNVVLLVDRLSKQENAIEIMKCNDCQYYNLPRVCNGCLKQKNG